MKKLLVLGLLAAVLVVGCGLEHKALTDLGQDSVATDPHNTIRTVQFQEPVSIDQLIDLEQRYGFKVEELRFEYDGMTCGYTVNGRELASVQDDFYRQHMDFLTHTQMKIAGGGQEKGRPSDAMMAGMIEECRSRSIGVPIVSLRNELADTTIHNLKLILRDDIVVLPTNRQIETIPVLVDSSHNAHGQPQSLWHERWAPYGGGSAVTRQYTDQSFIFNDGRDFVDNRTYEHETQIYDRNFANYAGYWATNMPSAYKDTPFMDSIDNFTVGCYRANQLQMNRWYWTYMSLSAQSHSTAVCRIKGQIGHRNPSWCYSTWCVFPDGTTGTMAYLALPNYGCSWQY
ncbi:MAG: hypothetical protein WC734_01730 [Patescibacteria group bacterium]|jgi:hypothetical protein